jgi:serine/threonine protein kinase
MASDAPITLGRAPAPWTLHRVPEAPPREFIGAVFGERYLVRRRIGAGGMSTVYEAQDTTVGKRVVVKILRDDLPSDPVDRFRREAHVLGGLSHEHIAHIIDRRDPEDGPRYLVTEYVDGHDFAELSARGKLPAAVVILVGLQVAAALAYAHEVGVIHRDIKPSNLMLMRHPSGDIFVKVIDFGIAKLLQDSELAAPENAPAGARRKTRDVDILGTAPFWCGEEGPTADVYALALTLAVLLTGRIPNAGAPVDLSDPAIPAKLTSVLQTALALDGKITTMNALDAALREASDLLDPKAAESDRRRYFAEMFPRAKPPAAAAGYAAPAPRAPRFADRYILCDELGQGGMGLVRTAFDPEFRRRVALKTMLPKYAGRERLQARFRREARALAAIDHPGVPRVYEIGSKPEPYFTMEIVEGLRLESETRIEPVRALSLAIDLAEILAVAHDAGVIHRDVKPANIVIGKGDRVRLLDFGMCLLLPRYHQRELLFPPTPPIERYETGEHERVAGTPGYTAPEVIAGEGTSVRSDIYSVCAVLYRMLRGQPLVDPSTSTSRPIRRGEFTGPLATVADLLRRGTARDPGDRPRNMADLLAELEALRSALRQAGRRQTLVRVVVLTALTSIVAALSAAWMFATPPKEPRDARVPVPAIIAVSPESPKPAPPPNAPTSPPKELAAGNKEIEEAKPAKDEKAPRPHGASPSPAPPVLTEDIVAARLKKQRDVFETCHARYHLLHVGIAAGRVTLLDVNGMPFSPGVPEHTCLADGLRQIRFPRASPAAGLVVPLDLRPAPERPR